MWLKEDMLALQGIVMTDMTVSERIRRVEYSQQRVNNKIDRLAYKTRAVQRKLLLALNESEVQSKDYYSWMSMYSKVEIWKHTPSDQEVFWQKASDLKDKTIAERQKVQALNEKLKKHIAMWNEANFALVIHSDLLCHARSFLNTQ